MVAFAHTISLAQIATLHMTIVPVKLVVKLVWPGGWADQCGQNPGSTCMYYQGSVHIYVYV